MFDRHLTQPALAELADIPTRSRWVRSGGVRLHALDYGGDRPPLVILPGITSPAIALDFVARELTDLTRPVVLDVRGRGLSDGAARYTLDDYAADTEALITGLGLDRPILLGHSMGARIAAVTAARTHAPLRGTVLVDPPMSGPGRQPYPTTLATFLAQLTEARRGTTTEEVAASWPRWPRREQRLRALWLASCGEHAISATHQGFEDEDFFDFWPQVPAHIVLIHGAESPVVTPSNAQEAASAHPSAHLLEVPDAGHMVYWDNPVTALSVTRDALRKLLATS